MIHRMFAAALLCLLSSCTSMNTPGGDYLDLEAVTFTAEDVSGQIQIRDHRRAPWHSLKKGEIFKSNL